MNKSHLIATLACTLGALALTAPAEARVNQRQHHQHARIAQGVHSGELTRHEAHGLRHQQRHIARYEARNRADGHGLNRRERAHLAAMQNRASSNIYRQKHDGQTRPR